MQSAHQGQQDGSRWLLFFDRYRDLDCDGDASGGDDGGGDVVGGDADGGDIVGGDADGGDADGGDVDGGDAHQVQHGSRWLLILRICLKGPQK